MKFTWLRNLLRRKPRMWIYVCGEPQSGRTWLHVGTNKVTIRDTPIAIAPLEHATAVVRAAKVFESYLGS